jgi:DNA helicase-4
MILNFLNKYIFNVSILNIETDGIYLNGSTIPFPPISLALSLSKGRFIHSLLINDKCYYFFKTDQIAVSQSSIDHLRATFWRGHYKKDFDSLISVSRVFDHYVNGYPRYIRANTRKEFLNRMNLNGVMDALKHEDEMRVLDFPVNDISILMKTFCQNPKGFLQEFNDRFIASKSLECKTLFDEIESNPLTDMQRIACVTDEQNVLVIAGAGTGKTSTMRAKAAYLVKQGYAKPEEILMLAYGSDAKKELEDRVYEINELKQVEIETFHSLGKKIIGFYSNKATDVDVLATDNKRYVKFIDEHVEALSKNPSLSKVLIEYFGQYFYSKPSEMDFKSNQEYQAYIANNELRDLNGNQVKSFEEIAISNYLFQAGINFEYEPRYEYEVSAPGKNVYKPDFYLPDFDVYIEHFGIDRKGNTRKGINKDKYNEERQWKIDTHADKGTVLIQTFSYESNQGLGDVLEEKLKKYCQDHELEFDELCSRPSSESVFSKLKELGLFKEFSRLMGDFINLFRNSHYTLENIPRINGTGYKSAREKIFHRLFKHVYNIYITDLDAKNSIDFSDMIRDANSIIEKDDFHIRTKSKFNYKYIMVDEFQDISKPRADLVTTLKKVGSNCALFCVGDDWQAIYRFTGSDVNLTTYFADEFGEVKKLYLDKTFRFNDRLERVASGFVQENKVQLKKDLNTHAKSNKTEVHVLTGSSDNVLRDALVRIDEDSKGNAASVLVLSRFNSSLKNVKGISAVFPNLKVRAMSAHAAKGKEAEYVVVLDVVKGKYGFPSEIETDSLLESLLPKLELFKHAEERRLFYVALSRAKKTVFIHTKLGYESAFLKELKSKKYDVNFYKNKLAEVYVESAICPQCGQGNLIPRQGDFGLFYVCSMNDDYCDEKIKHCPLCKKSPVIRNEDNHFCAASDCDYQVDTCPECGTGYLIERINRKTKESFLGCSQSHKDTKNRCNFTKNIKSVREV